MLHENYFSAVMNSLDMKEASQRKDSQPILHLSTDPGLTRWGHVCRKFVLFVIYYTISVNPVILRMHIPKLKSISAHAINTDKHMLEDFK